MSSSPLAGGVAYDVHLVGAVLALGYWYFGWSFGRLPGMDELKRLLRTPQRWFKAKPPLKVHDPEHYYEDLDAQADRLLEKVATRGPYVVSPIKNAGCWKTTAGGLGKNCASCCSLWLLLAKLR